MKLLIGIFLLALAMPAFPQNAPRTERSPVQPGCRSGLQRNGRRREKPPVPGQRRHGIAHHLQLATGSTIEVHLATTQFTKMAELNLRKGDKIEVTGWKTEFEGVQTIFAREVRARAGCVRFPRERRDPGLVDGFSY